MKTFSIYITDLKEETQAALIDFFGGDNGNYDIVPLVTFEWGVRDE